MTDIDPCIEKFKLLRAFTLSISVLIIIFLTLFDQGLRERNINITLNQIGLTDNSSNIKVFTNMHESHYMGAINMFKANILFGHGPKTFRKKCSYKEFEHDELTCSSHPHNIYLQLLSETGIFGILIFLNLLKLMIKC